MHLNPCKNNWELCLKEGLGVIGMQNKHVALETHGVFLPRPLQLNICRFRHGLNSVPRQSTARGWWAAGQCCQEGGQEGTLLLPRESQSLRGIKQSPEALPAPHPHHPHLGVKKQVMRMLFPELCLWPPLSHMPCSPPGELLGVLPP